MNNTFLFFSYLKPLEPSKKCNVLKIVFYICMIFCSLVLVKVISVNEFKKYLLANYSEELSRSSNWSSLTIGYMSEMSEGRRKCNIKTGKQLLEDAYKSIKNGWITLWVDPHSAVKRKQDEKERREGQAKRKTSGMIHI